MRRRSARHRPAPSPGWSCCCRFKTHPARQQRHRRAAAIGHRHRRRPAAPAPSAERDLRHRASASKTSAGPPRTVTGDTVETRWGPVQVQITVSERQDHQGRPRSDYPHGNPRDQEINSSPSRSSTRRRPAATEREDRHGLRRDVHQRGLHPVPAERAGQGGPVTAPAAAAPCTSSTAWARSSPSTSATPATGPPRSRTSSPGCTASTRIFSTYRPDSDVSRLHAARSASATRDPRWRRCSTCARELRGATGGCFSRLRRRPARPDRAGQGLGGGGAPAACCARAGSRNHRVNGGGDIQLAGGPEPGRPWRVGIADPLRPGRGLATACAGRDIAVATSGTAERGAHILDPLTGRPARASSPPSPWSGAASPAPTPTRPRRSSWGTPPATGSRACPGYEAVRNRAPTGGPGRPAACAPTVRPSLRPDPAARRGPRPGPAAWLSLRPGPAVPRGRRPGSAVRLGSRPGPAVRLSFRPGPAGRPCRPGRRWSRRPAAAGTGSARSPSRWSRR